jgi:ATP/maltotriose-dependent transcriptional regulator MalT
MELVERDGPLAALTEAHQQSAKGRGSVVLVTGEPGIGKTALVTRFAADLGDGARVLWGACDDLSVPRPLGPIRDLAGSASPALQEALSADSPPHQIHSLLLDELALPPRPTVVVVEDAHWVDQATVDAITFIGRRIGGLPALLILTYRAGEVDPDHPLHATLGALRSGTSLYLQLAPLSRSAVTALAGEEAEQVFAATGGNPFYVTEMIAAQRTELPRSVASAVLGRAARLHPGARRLVELVSMVPSRMPTKVLEVVMPDWTIEAEEPERRQLLSVTANSVQFRHELARAAIRSSVPASRRRTLHSQILSALLAIGADPADIVHHAEEAGDTETVAGHVLLAARRAAAVESNREALAHYRRAADFAGQLPLPQQATLFEDYAWIAYLVGKLDQAFAAIRRAIDLKGQLGDAEALGRCTRILSRFHWYAGEGEEAWREAENAIAILEPLGESVELARAYGGLSQLAMLSNRAEESLEMGRRALQLAERLGEEAVKAHALITTGLILMQEDPDNTATLSRGLDTALTAGEHHEVVRALIGFAYTEMEAARPEEAREHLEQGRSYAHEHQVDTLHAYLNVILASYHLRAGQWEEADRIARHEVDQGVSVAQLFARTILTELAVRRGDPDAARLLAELAVDADRTGEVQRIGPVVQLQIEAALLAGDSMPADRVGRMVELVGSHQLNSGMAAVRVAGWAALAGIPVGFEGKAPAPYAAMLAGDWARAADAFGAVGWDYERALMLALLDEENALDEAIDIARRLGAAPLQERITGRMRELGMMVPRGSRESTLANPAGLTSRQLEVWELLAEGLTNAEIAKRLFVSPRTAEHHVEAVLTKLGVSNRREAARRAAELKPFAG